MKHIPIEVIDLSEVSSIKVDLYLFLIGAETRIGPSGGSPQCCGAGNRSHNGLPAHERAIRSDRMAVINLAEGWSITVTHKCRVLDCGESAFAVPRSL